MQTCAHNKMLDIFFELEKLDFALMHFNHHKTLLKTSTDMNTNLL